MSRAAPVGAVVGLSYDSDEEVAPGDYLVTGRGRCYRVLAARTQGTHNPTRWKISAMVDSSAPASARKHPLVFYRRNRRGT